jgi:hypothetical protein
MKLVLSFIPQPANEIISSNQRKKMKVEGKDAAAASKQLSEHLKDLFVTESLCETIVDVKISPIIEMRHELIASIWHQQLND